MSDLRILLRGAIGELDCPRCANNRRGITRANGDQDECPECHGNLRHAGVIDLLTEIVSRVVAIDALRDDVLEADRQIDQYARSNALAQIAKRLQKASAE